MMKKFNRVAREGARQECAASSGAWIFGGPSDSLWTIR